MSSGLSEAPQSIGNTPVPEALTGQSTESASTRQGSVTPNRGRKNPRQHPTNRRRDNRDYGNAEEMRGVVHSLEEQMETMRQNSDRQQQTLDRLATMLSRMPGMPPENPPVGIRDASGTMQALPGAVPLMSGALPAHADYARPTVENPLYPPIPSDHGKRSLSDDQGSNQLGHHQQAGLRFSNTPGSHQDRPRRSERQGKIQELDDGSEPTYLQWKASVQDRLTVNADHFETERARKAFIWNATIGLAKTYLTPRYLSESHNFQHAEEMIKLLGDYFLTGLESDTARNAFQDCHMQQEGFSRESFAEFKSRFLALAIEGLVPESEWFHNLWTKLTPVLRSVSLGFKTAWNKNVHTMIQHLLSIDMERRRNLETIKPAPVAGPRPTTHKRSNPATPSRTSSGVLPNLTRPAYPSRPRTSTPSTNRSGTDHASKQVRTATAEDKCYNCHKFGHFKSQCPEPLLIKEMEVQEMEEGNHDFGEQADGSDSEKEQGNVEA